jgi:hypothetical protein
MKVPLVIGLAMLGGGVALIGMAISSHWPPPLIVPGAWLSIIGFILLAGSLFEQPFYKQILLAPPAGFIATSECFIDTRSGKPVRIYYQAASGERAYVAEPGTA